MKDKQDNNTPSLKTEEELAKFIATFWGDPYGFVMAVFPWGQPTLPDGSFNPLADKTGPEQWQKEELIALGEHIRDNVLLKELGLDQFVYRAAFASGHDVGKSAFVAWIIYFLMSTRVDTRGAVTASTQFQLEDKTWPELQKWHNMAINRHWFKWMATTFSFAAYTEERQKNYRTTAATVSETNTEAYQGLHNEGRTVFIIFDEASGVQSMIWEIIEGVLIEKAECFFFALGNPTKPTGEFFDCFEKHENIFTRLRHIDSREVSLTNKSAIRALVEKYGGEDEDEIKRRVRGVFPSVAYDGFMNAEAVRDCMQRDRAIVDTDEPLYMMIDVANQGGDEIVIGWRQGWDARTRKKRTFRNLKHSALVKQAIDAIYWSQPDIVIIECVGIGIPLCDDLQELGIRVFRAYPGAPIKENYVNNRAVWWAAARDWIYEPLSALEDDQEQFDQFTKIQYFLRRTDGKTLIESKADIRARNLPSPDRADMFVLSFAVKLPRRNLNFARNSLQRTRSAKLQDDPIEA